MEEQIPLNHRVRIRKSAHVLWHIRCRCGWFHGQVTYAATLRDALGHLDRKQGEDVRTGRCTRKSGGPS